jgi:HlyD family secretion protein
MFDTNQKKQENKLYRQESLDRLASPERLDQLMRVVAPKNWLPLATIGSVVLTAFVWSIFGRIPVTVEGRGVLIYPSKIAQLQSRGSGQLLLLNVKEGDRVKKGDIIATVDRVDLRNQLQLAREKLAQLQGQDRDVGVLQGQKSESEITAITEQRQTLQERLKIVQNITPLLREKGVEAIRRERLTLQNRLKKLQELIPTFKERLEIRQKVFQEGAISGDQLLQSRQEYIESNAKIDEAESQLKQLDVKEAEALQKYLSNLNEIKDIQAQLQELDSKQATLAQQDLETSTTRKKEIQEVEREIAQLEKQVGTDTQVISQHSGRITEVVVHSGQVVDAGTRIANIEVENPDEKLVGIAYFPIKDAKKIQTKMTIQITPQTVKRERFGGIVGSVTNVSSFPITKEAAAKVVGNPEVVEGLASTPQEGLMQVSATLNADSTTFSGYQWSSSSGPNLKISTGTTTVVRVKLDERAPITYIFPILRSVSGIY